MQELDKGGQLELEEMQEPYKIVLLRQWRSLKAARIRSVQQWQRAVQQRQRVVRAWASTYEIGTGLDSIGAAPMAASSVDSDDGIEEEEKEDDETELDADDEDEAELDLNMMASVD